MTAQTLAHLWTTDQPQPWDRPVCRAAVRAAGDPHPTQPRCPACLAALDQMAADADAAMARTDATLAALDQIRADEAAEARRLATLAALDRLRRLAATA